MYPGLTVFEEEGRRLMNVLDLPGVAEGNFFSQVSEALTHSLFFVAGRWTSLSVYRSTTERDRTMNQSRLHGQLKALFDKVRGHKACRQLLSYPLEDDQVCAHSARESFNLFSGY